MATAAPPPQDPRYAWRTQRDAWKAQARAQRHYYRGFRRPSLAGPIVLVIIGVVFLLLQTGKLDRFEFWNWYSHWWPLLLIGLGTITLVEWYVDRNSPYPTHRSVGGIVVWLVILSVFGGVTNTFHNFAPIVQDFGDSGDDFSFFRGPEHTNDDQIVKEMPEQPSVQIQNPRGDVVITASTDSRMHIDAHEVVHSNSDSDAKKQFSELLPKVTSSGNSVIVHVDGAANGSSVLTIELPLPSSVNVNAARGDVTVSGVRGAVNVVSGHGDVKLEGLAGLAHARMSKGDFSAHDIHGEISVDGHGGDVTLSEIHNKVLIDGDFFGDVHLQQVSAPVHFHSSHIDIELARVDGDLTLDKDDLNMQQVVGPSKIVARSKEIEGSQMSGDIHLENENGDVTVNSVAPLGNIQITNEKGAIKFSAPPNVGFSIEAHSNDGEIDTEFPLNVTGNDSSHSVSGQVGRGGPKVVLTAIHGDIHLTRGDGTQGLERPEAPERPEKPERPSSAGRHLKAKPGEDEQTAVQQ
jgi:DUF4097 and DUF4098 domain-containing protein YvlB